MSNGGAYGGRLYLRFVLGERTSLLRNAEIGASRTACSASGQAVGVLAQTSHFACTRGAARLLPFWLGFGCAVC